MCYSSAEVMEDPPESAEEVWVSRRLEFSGPCQGSFGVRVAKPAARLLGSSFLGQDIEEEDDVQPGEIVGEIANMICGAVLSRMEPNLAFALSPPYDDQDSSRSAPPSPTRMELAFELEEGRLFAWLEIRQSS
jgi:hypothetical protein